MSLLRFVKPSNRMGTSSSASITIWKYFSYCITFAKMVFTPSIEKMSQDARQLLVIEDHAIYRAGLISAIEGIDCIRITEVCAVEHALALDIVPDLILLDIQLDGMSGLQGMAELHQRWPATKIIIISANDSYSNAQSALESGATAFLSKSDTTATILSVVSRALQNLQAECRMSPLIQNRIAHTPKLSARQIDVLQLVAKGHSNKTIGQMLHISENTARWHVCTMISVLQASTRTEAVFTARELGLLS